MSTGGYTARLQCGAAGVAFCLWAACSGAQTSTAAEPGAVIQPELLDLGDNENGFGCLAARGELVILLKPGVGAVVLALAEFPGAERIGTIEGKVARFSIPGLRMPELSITSRVVYVESVQLWGRTVADVDSDGQPGCFALERPAGGDAEDLEALVRRGVFQCLSTSDRGCGGES